MNDGRRHDRRQAAEQGGARRKSRKEQQREQSRRPARVQPTPNPRMSRSLEYGVAMLECFTPDHAIAGVVNLSAVLGLGRSTTHRYAATLHALGYLEQDEHRKYRLSRLALDPGMAAIGAVRAAVPVGDALAQLRAWAGHTVSMGALDELRAVYVHRLHAHRAGQHAVDGERRVGSSVPLHCTGLGKALLAALPQDRRAKLLDELPLTAHGPRSITDRHRLSAELEGIRERGFALSDEELAVGVRSVAAALDVWDGARPVAIDVSVSASAYTVERLAQELGPLVVRAAARISALSQT
jgi:IclR family transcriptional regulator, pca regulon regulatory protein